VKVFRVLNVAFPFALVCDDTAGGAEQVLGVLDTALVKHGWESFVIAGQGSRVSGTLINGPSIPAVIDKNSESEVRHEYKKIIERVISDFEIDLIHFHGLDFAEYLPDTGIPVLVTLHLPVAWYKGLIERPGLFYNCVSANQMETCGSLGGMIGTITNGVAVNDKYIKKVKGRYAFMMGRVCPEKGFHLGFSASMRAGVASVLAGTVFPYLAHQQYFSNIIVPLLSFQKNRYVGNVGGVKKSRLLGFSMCLLAPSLVKETSSLVAMEAMANGTPVIAFKNGAFGEIIKDNVTGFLVNDEIEMADAISETGRIDPEECFFHVKKNYSIERMVSEYLDLYEKIITGGKELYLKLNKNENRRTYRL
jgi:glycosyltransferase involved in cell wall biosynthesis